MPHTGKRVVTHDEYCSNPPLVMSGCYPFESIHVRWYTRSTFVLSFQKPQELVQDLQIEPTCAVLLLLQVVCSWGPLDFLLSPCCRWGGTPTLFLQTEIPHIVKGEEAAS
jgi:hypothetical protein